MSSLNKVMLIGNLGKDPEIKTLQNGGKVANLTVATTERWKDKESGERKERTEWHRVVIWNEHLVEIAQKFLTKGDKVYFEGQLQTRKWQDKDKQDRYSTEVVLPRFGGSITMLSTKGDKPKAEDHGAGPMGDRQDHRSTPELNDDIPF